MTKPKLKTIDVEQWDSRGNHWMETFKIIPIKDSDIPCRQCGSNKQGGYVANTCDREAMEKCPCWHYRNTATESLASRRVLK